MIDAREFGALGADDDTDALQAWLDMLQSTGEVGLLTGRHRVRRGALRWPVHPDRHSPGPVIYTGSGTTLEAIPGSGPGALFSIENVRPYGVRGGFVGSLYFEDASGEDRTDCHGLSLSGIELMNFEGLFGTRLSGDVVHVQDRSVNNNPDPYHVFGCSFGAIRADRCRGWALNNNLVGSGFGGNSIRVVYALHCGAWRGAGAGNRAGWISCMNSPGWAVDWFPSPGHTMTRNAIDGGELDGVRYGVRVGGHRRASIMGVRFVHRRWSWTDREQGIDNPGNWPVVAVQVDGAAADIAMNVEHVIQTDATEVGVLYNFAQDSNLRRLEISTTVTGNPGLVADASMVRSLHPSATLTFRRDGRVIVQRTA